MSHLTPADRGAEPVKAPTEQKVTAASRGAGAGGVLAGLIIWALGRWAFPGDDVPGEVSTAVLAAVPMLLAQIEGWRAPHTPRPDLQPEET